MSENDDWRVWDETESPGCPWIPTPTLQEQAVGGDLP